MKNRIKQKAKHELLNSFFHYYLEWATEYENLSKEYKEYKADKTRDERRVEYEVSWHRQPKNGTCSRVNTPVLEDEFYYRLDTER